VLTGDETIAIEFGSKLFALFDLHHKAPGCKVDCGGGFGFGLIGWVTHAVSPFGTAEQVWVRQTFNQNVSLQGAFLAANCRPTACSKVPQI
jgi:hypothetical protein